jgi:hypothetical protein
MYTGKFFPPGAKRLGREADQLPQLVPKSKKFHSTHPFPHGIVFD